MKTHNCVGMELRTLFNMIRRSRTKISTKYDDDPSTILHHQTIVFLHMNRDKDVFQRDIEQEFEVRRPTATKFLRLMEQNGLIIRKGVDYDARLKKIILTEKGSEIINIAAEKFDEFEKQLTLGLTDEEIAIFITIIHKIKKNLE